MKNYNFAIKVLMAWVNCLYPHIIQLKISSSKFEDINSIDEASEIYRYFLIDNSIVNDNLENIELDIKISPEDEFWGHCSNIQTWVENDYDTRFLHRSLAFPILKKLSALGDPTAKIRFHEEIAKRLRNGTDNVQKFLVEEGYLNHLSHEELLFSCLDNGEAQIILNLEDKLGVNFEIEFGNYLDYLSFESTGTSGIPYFFIEGKHIHALRFDNCQLEEFPDLICDLQELKYLGFFNNKLTSIPKDAIRLENLIELDLSQNFFKEVPAIICKLSNLKRLIIEENQIKVIPECIRMSKILFVDL